MRKTFAVGRLTPSTAEIVLVDQTEDRDGTRFPGPWTLQAIVRHLSPEPRLEPGSTVVH